jgi:hypothetical protein
LLLCCDSKRLAKFGSIATAPPSMEGPRHESQDGDSTVVSALVGLPDNVLGTNAQSAATHLPTPGCEQPGVSTTSTSVAAGCSPSQYHPASASGTSTFCSWRLFCRCRAVDIDSGVSWLRASARLRDWPAYLEARYSPPPVRGFGHSSSDANVRHRGYVPA